MLQTIASNKAPKAVGPYSQAVVANGFVFVSGQIPIIPDTGELLSDSITNQTKRIMTNIQAILQEAGSDLSKVVKTTIYLKDLAAYEEVNNAYGEFFASTKPARVTVQVARLPRDSSIEIDAIAIK